MPFPGPAEIIDALNIRQLKLIALTMFASTEHCHGVVVLPARVDDYAPAESKTCRQCRQRPVLIPSRYVPTVLPPLKHFFTLCSLWQGNTGGGSRALHATMASTSMKRRRGGLVAINPWKKRRLRTEGFA